MIVLDTNAFNQTRPFSDTKLQKLLSLSKRNKVDLIVPEVVLLEISRQINERLDECRRELSEKVKAYNKTALDFGVDEVLVTPEIRDRESLYLHTREFLEGRSARIGHVPEVPVAKLLTLDIDTRKPFDRNGTGFRDALIWETVLETLSHLNGGAAKVFFITEDGDFRDKKTTSVHPDLKQDLKAEQDVIVIPNIHSLLEHAAVKPLVGSALRMKKLEEEFSQEQLFALLDESLSSLSGESVDELFGEHHSDGIFYGSTITALVEATFGAIVPHRNSISHRVYVASGNDKYILEVTVEADCEFDGAIDKWLFINEGVVVG